MDHTPGPNRGKAAQKVGRELLGNLLEPQSIDFIGQIVDQGPQPEPTEKKCRDGREEKRGNPQRSNPAHRRSKGQRRSAPHGIKKYAMYELIHDIPCPRGAVISSGTDI